MVNKSYKFRIYPNPTQETILSKTLGCCRCHVCGFKNIVVKDLSVRTWICPECGANHDRDINAAKNILNKGIEILA